MPMEMEEMMVNARGGAYEGCISAIFAAGAEVESNVMSKWMRQSGSRLLHTITVMWRGSISSLCCSRNMLHGAIRRIYAEIGVSSEQ